VYVYEGYVEYREVRYWHPEHYECFYDANGTRWERFVPGHYGNRPYQY
jgi:hypothetical protein